MRCKWARRRFAFVFAAVVMTMPGAVARGTIPEDPGPIWTARYNGPGNFGDAANSVVVSPDGTQIFVTGYTGAVYGSGGYNDYATVAYSSASGAQLWTARYNGPGSSFDYATSLAVSPDGSKVFVTGGSAGLSGYTDYATIAYSAANGARLWTARYEGAGNFNPFSDYARSLAVSPDGSKVFVTGESEDADGHSDYATVAYSAASGTQLWNALYNGPSGEGDYATSLAVSRDGSKVFVTGGSDSSGDSSDYATVAYSAASGGELWSSRYNGPGNNTDYAHALVVSPDGSEVFVTGESHGLGSHSDYATVAYSAASGGELWSSRYNGSGNADDHARALSLSPDGSEVFVTGRSAALELGIDNFDFDYATIAYSSSNGTQLWASRYNGPANARDVANSIAASADGLKVFVTGGSVGSDGLWDDYATVAYSGATGRELWVARYDGSGQRSLPHDQASSLAVSPDGSKVFVTGSSRGSQYYDVDIATIAYRSSSCAAGWDEDGPVSNPVHQVVEPQAGPLTPYIHGTNCDLVSGNGL